MRSPSYRNIDEIVLSYVVDILEGVGEEESSFDVDQFVEMISAYVPEFAEVERSEVIHVTLSCHPG